MIESHVANVLCSEDAINQTLNRMKKYHWIMIMDCYFLRYNLRNCLGQTNTLEGYVCVHRKVR